MRILLDTNVLCRLAERGHPSHALAEVAVAKLQSTGHDLCLVPQVLYEYWVVATRPAMQNGLGMPAQIVNKAVDLWSELFTVLLDERGIYSHWRELMRRHGVQGKNAHDARIVAAMLRHGLSLLLTFNADDFSRYPEINVQTPQKIGNGVLP
jgi:predicted nucleic acid-binding protein